MRGKGLARPWTRWVTAAGATQRPVGAPLQLLPSTAFDWVHAAAPPSVAEITGAEAAGAVWAGLPLNT